MELAERFSHVWKEVYNEQRELNFDQSHPVDDLLVQHWPSIHAFISSRAHSNDRDDVMQATAIHILNHKHEFDPSKASFPTWATWHAKAAIRDHYTARKRQPKSIGNVDPNSASESRIPSTRQRRGGAMHPVMRAPVDTEHINLIPLIDKIPDARHRQILQLRMQGLSHHDIATQMNITPDNARQLTKRAMDTLKAMRQQHDARDSLKERFAAIWSEVCERQS